jgi:hypothetical protein
MNPLPSAFSHVASGFTRADKIFRNLYPSLFASSAPTSLSPPPSPPPERAEITAPQTEIIPSPNRPLGIDIDGNLLRQFLASMDFDLTASAIPRNRELESALLDVFTAENLPEKYIRHIEKMLLYTTAATEMCYLIHSFEFKVFIGTYITLLLFIDDLCERDPDSMVPYLRTFVAKLGSNSDISDQHPSLRHFQRLVTDDAPKFFGPIGCGMVMKSTVDYYLGCLLEAQFPDGVKCSSSCTRFPRFLRLKSGNSETFAHMIFPATEFPEDKYLEIYLPTIPDIIELTDMINDILSFYKESVIGTEKNTFFMVLAKANNMHPVDVLIQTGTRQGQLARDVRQTLSKCPELLKAFNTYLNGYTMYHCTQKRYKLWELGVEMICPGEEGQNRG